MFHVPYAHHTSMAYKYYHKWYLVLTKEGACAPFTKQGAWGRLLSFQYYQANNKGET